MALDLHTGTFPPMCRRLFVKSLWLDDKLPLYIAQRILPQAWTEMSGMEVLWDLYRGLTLSAIVMPLQMTRAQLPAGPSVAVAGCKAALQSIQTPQDLQKKHRETYQ